MLIHKSHLLTKMPIWQPNILTLFGNLWYPLGMRKKQRPVIYKDLWAEVPIYSKGEVYYSSVDFEDAPLAEGKFWSKTAGGYAISQGVYLHRAILDAGAYEEVDHKNGNRLDNRRSNLRLVTRQQNQMARHVSVGKTGYKGVGKHGLGYRASIKFNGKSIRLGTYPTPEKAARAYNQAALALFGEYAVINEVKK